MSRDVRKRLLKTNEGIIQNPYWQRYLSGSDKEFMAGYDSLAEEIKGSIMPSILDMIEHDDERALIGEGYEKLLQLIENNRNHIVTCMLDDMDENEYQKCKEQADNEADEIEKVLARLMVFIRDKAAAVEGVKEAVPDLSLVYGYESLEGGLVAEYKDNKIYVTMEESLYFIARNILITYAHICLKGDETSVEQVKKANEWATEQMAVFWEEVTNE